MAIIDVIKYEGDNTTFVWKHPREDFNTQAQLVVHENQEAIFMYNGQILDVFGAGAFTLNTENMPLLRAAVGLVTGGASPFHCEVYFLNKSEQMAIKWGTDTKVQYIEPVYNFPISIGASGEMSLRVADSRKLLLKLVGTENGLGQQTLMSYFRAYMMARIKPHLAAAIQQKGINIFEIDSRMGELSEELKNKLQPDFVDYGLELERFFISTIVKPEGEHEYETCKKLYFRQFADVAEAKLRQQVEVIDQETLSQKTVMEAQATAQKRDIEGYTYHQERSFDVAEKMAENEATGQYTNLGVGLGTAAAVGSAAGQITGEVLTELRPQSKQPGQNKFCENCGEQLEEQAKFCHNCGTSVQNAPVVCAQCGNDMAPTAKFCSSCGTKRAE